LANRYRPGRVIRFLHLGDFQLHKLSHLAVSTAVLLATAASASALAAPAPAAKPAARPAPQSMSRTTLIQNLATQFKAIDTNNNGGIEAAEAGAAESKVEQQRLGAMFTKLDINKDGQLSRAEFMSLAPAPNGGAIVAKLDKNKDGKVSSDEYAAGPLAGFDRADTNKDGVLSPAERQAKK
jgi:hypothetical protein